MFWTNELKVWASDGWRFGFLQTWWSRWYAGIAFGVWRFTFRIGYINDAAMPKPEPLDAEDYVGLK